MKVVPKSSINTPLKNGVFFFQFVGFKTVNVYITNFLHEPMWRPDENM